MKRCRDNTLAFKKQPDAHSLLPCERAGLIPPLFPDGVSTLSVEKIARQMMSSNAYTESMHV